MFAIEISFGQTATHSPSFEQLPNPSASICVTIAAARRTRSGSPCGRIARCEILAPTNSTADAFLHAATHAPHAMQAAESIAASATSRGIGVLLASGAPPALIET